jgi:hypothetical protein
MSPEQYRPICVPGLFYLMCERLGFDHGFIWTWWRALATSDDDLRFSIELFSCHLDDTDDNMHFFMEQYKPTRFLNSLDRIAQDQTLAPEDIERIRVAIFHNVDTHGLWLQY